VRSQARDAAREGRHAAEVLRDAVRINEERRGGDVGDIEDGKPG